MSKQIRSIAEAIGIIEKEVEKAMSEATIEKKTEETSKYCVECNAIVTHPGAHFCKLCAAEFYNEVTTVNEVSVDNEGEGE